MAEFHSPLNSYVLPDNSGDFMNTTPTGSPSESMGMSMGLIGNRRPPPVPTSSPPPLPGKEFVLDHSRDLMLLVGGPPMEKCYSIVVSSQILRIASPVWYVMLDPTKSWKETTTKTIPLPDDDPDALLLILQIAHLKFGAVPRSCSFDMLLKLAILADKYDVAGLVRPYLDGWVDGVKDTVNKPGHEGWLFISWTFGLVGTFTRVSKCLVMGAKRDEKGALVTAEGRPLEDGVMMPVGAIERINSFREDTLHSIESLCLEYISRFNTNGPPICKNSTRHCDVTVFGSLVFSLRTYFPIMGPAPCPYINLSINDLCERLNAMQLYTFPATWSAGNSGGGPSFGNLKKDYAYYSPHKSCNLGEEMQRRVQRLVADTESPVAEEQVKHMQKQREKCGSFDISTEA